MYFYVYKITDPETKQFYIGSRQCECEPKDDNYMGSYKTWEPINENRLEKEIIKSDFKTREDAFDYEDELIQQYWNNPLNENYHRPNGSFSMNGRKHSDETKNKIRKSHLGNKHIKSTKEKISKSVKKWIEIHGNPMEGKHHSDETKKEHSIRMKKYYKNNKHPWVGRTHKKSTLNKIRKKVIHIRSGKIFNSTYDAAQYFGINQCTVSRHCNGKRLKENTKFKFYE